MKGLLYGVSVGPGDPELLTVKAVKTIEKCSVIATPKTKENNTLAFDIASGICDMNDKEILYLEFLMTRDKDLLFKNHMGIANDIKKYLDKGIDVCMLNLGDTSVYSTFSYIMEILQEDNYEVQVIPGITSFCAIASTLQMSLTTMNEPLHILPAGSLEDIINFTGTKVIMKSGKNIKEVKKIIKANNKDVVAISNCGLPNEAIYKNVDEIPEDSSYFTTIIMK